MLDTWVSEVNQIVANLGFDTQLNDGDSYDITAAYNTLLKNSRLKWHLEAQRKPKLRTFVKIHNFDQIQILAKSNITRYQKSLLSQLKLGILPLKIETDRYQGIPLENRICQLCDENSIEDETHFLFHCPGLNQTRSLFDNSSCDQINDDYLKLFDMLNDSNITYTAKFVESMYKARRKMIYN